MVDRGRLIVVFGGILLPYVVRLARGWSWVEQYLGTGLVGFLFFSFFNAIAWGGLFVATLWLKRPASLVLTATPAFLFLAWAHFHLDLASDAQAPVALVFIPIYALAFVAVGACFGYPLDRFLINREMKKRATG